MCLLDTADGALMMALYSSTAAAKDRVTVLYYSIVLTIITIVVAIVIGVIQLLSLILNVAEPGGKFWVGHDIWVGPFRIDISQAGVGIAGDHYDIIGKLTLERGPTQSR